MIKNNIVPPTISIKQREAVLCRLWSNRARLSQAEWEDLYEHVSFGLRNMCRAPELNSLGDERDSYIAQYFLLKVFEEVSHHSSPPQHFGALCVYFRNFLKDIVKSAENRYMTPFDDPDDGEESPANRVPDDCENRDETETLLREANLSETSVRLAAETSPESAKAWPRSPDTRPPASAARRNSRMASAYWPFTVKTRPSAMWAGA